MNNHEKLTTRKTFAFTLNRTGPPVESMKQTLERLQAGDLTTEEIEHIRETFKNLSDEIKAEQKHFLQSRGFPPDLAQAVRVAMADLFGEFVTTEEIEEYSMDKIWDLLQTAYDRRQWLANSQESRTDDSNWPTITTVAAGLGINKGIVTRLVTAGEIRDNGKSGTPRRIDPASVLEYCQRKGIAYNDL